MTGYCDNIYKGNKWDVEIWRNRVVRDVLSENIALEMRLEKRG